MNRVDPADLKSFARKYIWWKSPDEAVLHPVRVISQVMEIGDFDDVKRLNELVGDAVFVEALQQADAGTFRPRSWHYWHYRLGLAHDSSQIPPMPLRKIE